MKETLKKSKQGVASLYIVIFATILFGVITLSFIRITVSELSQTNDSDLSQSAYDAALAGIEDAKVLVNRYYTSKSKGNSLKTEDVFNDDCFTLSKMLYGKTDGSEVPIQESINAGETNSANQAYTCVTLSNQVENYKFTLNSESRVHVVPLAIANDANKFSKVKFYWYTEKNGTNLKLYGEDQANENTIIPLFGNKSNATTPPAITLGFITVGATVNMDELNKRDEKNFLTVALVPSTEASRTNNVMSANDLRAARNINMENQPFKVKCEEPGQNQEYACEVTLDVEDIKREGGGASGGNAYLVVSMPYGAVETDCQVVKETGAGNVSPFEDVQVKVDSTGRAADLYRRVEARLNPAEVSFPFPQFEIDLSGANGKEKGQLNKNMWVTKNCWGNGCKNSSL